MYNDELQHGPFKYVKREWKNGRWQYFYDTDAKKRDKAYKSNKGTLEAYSKHGNKYSRNMPGNSSDDSRPGRKTSRGEIARGVAKATGDYTKWNKITRQHASELKGQQALRGTRFDNTMSRNVPGKSYKSQEDGKVSKNKMTKVQRSKAMFHATVHKVKRECKKQIARAQSWISGLFD